VDNVRKSKDPCGFGFLTKIALLSINYSDEIHRSHHTRQQKFILIGVIVFHVELSQNLWSTTDILDVAVYSVYTRWVGQDICFVGVVSPISFTVLSPSSSALSEANNKYTGYWSMKLNHLNVTSIIAPLHSKSDSSTKTGQIIVNSLGFKKNEAWDVKGHLA